MPDLRYGTPLKNRSKLCVTHHHACDCREEYLESLVDENAILREKYDWLVKEHYRVVTYQCDKEVFPELQSAIERLTMRVKAAEKLLVGLTAEDLAGNEVWALPVIQQQLDAFWERCYESNETPRSPALQSTSFKEVVEQRRDIA